MQHHLNKTTVFRKGSKNFFFASIFFSPKVRNDIATLYGFVRIVDDFVDSIPQDITAFKEFYAQYDALHNGRDYPSNQYTTIIQDLIDTMKQYTIDPRWIESFFDSMRMDTEPTSYKLEQTLLEYIYGSAEVIGLCIVRICNLPQAAYQSAQLMGRAFQYINFIRDIKADFQLGRIYLVPQTIPIEEYRTIVQSAQPTEAFNTFIRQSINKYRHWCSTSALDLHLFTFSAHVAIKIAVLIFDCIAKKIYDTPSLVLKKKITVTLRSKMIFVIHAILSVAKQRLGKNNHKSK